MRKKIILLVMCCALFTACGANSENDTKNQDTTSVITDDTHSMLDVQNEKIKITVYSGNENADGFIQTDTWVDEINENALLEQLVEAGVLPETVEITALEQEDGTLTIRLNDAFRNHLFTQGTAGEYLVIGSLVNTFLKAYDAQNVYLYIGEDVLETGHNIYDYALEFYE